MTCDGNNATPPSPAIAPGLDCDDPRRAVDAYLARTGGAPIDPGIPAVVPGFDAPFFQAGLAGYSDAAMRIIARRHGCPFCVTEALLDRTILAGGRGFAKADLGDLEDNVPGGAEDQPLAGQIMGSDPAEMAAAALKMAEQATRPEREYRRLAYAGALAPGQTPDAAAARPVPLRLPGGEQLPPFDPTADLSASDPASSPRHSVSPSLSLTFATIDINLACPVKKVDRRARGGHWLAEPDGAIAILERVRDTVPAHVPCTVKLRRAYDDTPEMAENIHRILDAAFRIGYAWATVHARTVQQKYIGPSRWDLLRDIAARHPASSGRLIFGSGDVWNAGDVFRMLAYTGVSAVAVARGCIGNPWIFRQARGLLGLPVPSSPAGRGAAASGGRAGGGSTSLLPIPSPRSFAPRPATAPHHDPLASPSIAEQREVLESHFRLALAVNFAGHSSLAQQRRAEVYTGKTMRKFGIRFAAHHPRADEVRQRFIAVSSLDDWRAVLEEYYPTADAPAPGRSMSTPATGGAIAPPRRSPSVPAP
jgi:tRNA-dihydrouridine synthase